MIKNKKNTIISDIFILFTAFILITGLTSCSNKHTAAIETYKVQKGTIMQTVTSSGSIDASDKKNYTLQSPGEVLEVLATGSKFKKGDTLIKVDNSKTQLLVSQTEENLVTAQNSIDIAKINYQNALDANHVAIQLAQSNSVLSEQATQNALTSLENANSAADASLNSARLSTENAAAAADTSINSAKVALDIAQRNYDRVKALPHTDDEINQANDSLQTAKAAYYQAVTQVENSTSTAEAAYEQAKASAQSQAESAEAAYKQAINSQSASYWNNLNSKEAATIQIKLTGANIKQAETQLELSNINLELTKLELDKNQISAPFDGIVLSSTFSDGEFAGQGMTAISVISSQFIVKADVNETDIAKLNPGQKVETTLDAYPDKLFQGEITEISPTSKNLAGIVSFEIKIKPDDSAQSYLKYGLSANVTIIISKVENVLYAPLQSVYEENGKKYVDVLTENNESKKVEITTGNQNYDYIEIKSGLTEGDQIITSKTEAAASGNMFSQ